MFIFNNIHDRNYKKIYESENKVIFDITEKQINNAKNGEWNEMAVGDIACVVGSSRKVSTFYVITEIKGLGDNDDEYGETFLLRGEVIAKPLKDQEMTTLLQKHGVEHKYLPNNQFSNGFNVGNLRDALGSLEVQTRGGIVSLSSLEPNA